VGSAVRSPTPLRVWLTMFDASVPIDRHVRVVANAARLVVKSYIKRAKTMAVRALKAPFANELGTAPRVPAPLATTNPIFMSENGQLILPATSTIRT
jgi:hypothetical protein